ELTRQPRNSQAAVPVLALSFRSTAANAWGAGSAVHRDGSGRRCSARLGSSTGRLPLRSHVALSNVISAIVFAVDWYPRCPPSLERQPHVGPGSLARPGGVD